MHFSPASTRLTGAAEIMLYSSSSNRPEVDVKFISLLLLTVALTAAVLPLNVAAQMTQDARTTIVASAEFFIEPVAERRVTSLPDGELYWQIETFPSQEEAAATAASAGPYALTASVAGRNWLFVLGSAAMSSYGGAPVARLGPIAVPVAKIYLLRINRAGGPYGANTPIHSHPGSEAIYVLQGEVTQRMAHGIEVASAGEALNAHAPQMVMQLISTGERDLEQLVLFVVDAERPFAPTAQFDAVPN